MIARKKSEGTAAGLELKTMEERWKVGGDDDLDLDEEDGAEDDVESDGWAAENDIELPPDLDLVASPKDTSGQATDDRY